jgi:capsular polysaccharide biosynthesis protein
LDDGRLLVYSLNSFHNLLPKVLMELRDYYRIARRWWYLILLPPLVVGAYGLATYRAPAGAFTAGVRYTVGQPAGPAANSGYDPNYYRFLTSEYITTAFSGWVRTQRFAEAVSARLAAGGVEIPAAALHASLASDFSRSQMTVYLTWPNAEQIPLIFDAITAALGQNAEVFPQLGGLAAQVTQLDSATPGAIPPSLRARLDLPLKVAIALAFGAALALAAHYLDPFVRDRRDLEALDVPVLGEIPRTRQ